MVRSTAEGPRAAISRSQLHVKAPPSKLVRQPRLSCSDRCDHGGDEGRAAVPVVQQRAHIDQPDGTATAQVAASAST
jgi:hypothetical protein